jgi:hypothetical protein
VKTAKTDASRFADLPPNVQVVSTAHRVGINAAEAMAVVWNAWRDGMATTEPSAIEYDAREELLTKGLIEVKAIGAFGTAALQPSAYLREYSAPLPATPRLDLAALPMSRTKADTAPLSRSLLSGLIGARS